MGKRLVGTDNLDAFICQEDATLYADQTIILTPGARDELARRGVHVVYGPRPQTAACPHAPDAGACPPGLEGLLGTVAAILADKHGITDPEQLKAISHQVIKTIRENI